MPSFRNEHGRSFLNDGIRAVADRDYQIIRLVSIKKKKVVECTALGALRSETEKNHVRNSYGRHGT